MKRLLAISIVFIAAMAIALHFGRSRIPPPQRASKILVVKTKHKLLLMDGGNNVIRTYSIAIGRGGDEPKQRQGDHKSPEGIYVIDRHKKAADSIAPFMCHTPTTLTVSAHGKQVLTRAET